MALSRQEREAFLAEPHIGSFAVDAGAGRGPLVVPIWYQYEPGGEVWVLTGRDSRKAALLERAGRFSLLAERVAPSIRYVSVEGPVVSSAPMTEAELREMTARYLPPEKVDGYVAASDVSAGVTFRMRPEHWNAADLG
ncbi:pyridoxamine 5'-phosphate oxidase family protein [Streptomyces boncukensis]|uniref:Pyridoxamine 5'-phosphate oxidase family protein n=1 Tax=Streptomyces boncukensis TaxID=2711219 RepID=A0A6G4WZ39_9ACTN|nr:pyridoxamine 5'-phosphate oxidase family protein [Streptomyces boncukensis]NGO70556.1 pyridoxamine 5'-phosphate oxidase family protein [Streptomyces boncukensis]